MITIHPAQEENAEAIAEIGQSVQRPKDLNPEEIPQLEEKGFLTYSKSANQYRELIKKTPLSLIAKDENEKVVGYLLVYEQSLCEELYNPPKALPKFYNALLENMNGNTLYLEQIARHSDNAKQGIAQKMHDHLSQNHPNHTLLAGMIHKPMMNRASYHFFIDKNGYELIFEGEEDDQTAGLYKKTRK